MDNLNIQENVAQFISNRLYKNPETNLVYIMNVLKTESIEEIVQLGKYKNEIIGCKQIIRDYVFKRDSGIRIAIERHFEEYSDSKNFLQFDYDCFNRYNFKCFVHIEWELFDVVKFNRKNVELEFIDMMVCDRIIFNLLSNISRKNINSTGEELINIKHMPLIRKYGYRKKIDLKKTKYYSTKLDGVRENFCIYGKYLQVDNDTFVFKNHWFGQTIIGHCEVLDDNCIVLIDVYLVSENFHLLAKENNVSIKNATQNYHINKSSDIGSCGGNEYKNQDEFFHARRISNKIKFLRPTAAIEILKIIKGVCRDEDEFPVKVQHFYRNHNKAIDSIPNCNFKIDGLLGYTDFEIYKLKNKLSVDLIFKFDEMFKSMCRKMKISDVKKAVVFINKQKTFDWKLFESKNPDVFNKNIIDYLYFSGKVKFSKNFKDWQVFVDLNSFQKNLNMLKCSFFIILVEFEIDLKNKTIKFIRMRTDKCSANSYKIFDKILKCI